MKNSLYYFARQYLKFFVARRNKEFNGYYSIRQVLYYCSACRIHADHALFYINYHSISENFSNISHSKCCVCDGSVSHITPITGCRRCFLNYLDGERERGFARETHFSISTWMTPVPLLATILSTNYCPTYPTSMKQNVEK